MTLLQESYGAIYIGATVSYGLYGIALGQFIIFCRKIDKTEMAINCMVTFTWAMDTLQQFLITHAVWFYLVNRARGDVGDRYNVNWSLEAQGIPSLVLTLTAQSFFVIRLWRFSGKKWTSILFVPIVAAFALSLTWTIRSFVEPALLVYIPDTHTGIADVTATAILETANSCCLIADVGISAILCFQLWKHRSDSLGGSKTIVDALIRYSLTTGLLSSIITLLSLLLYVSSAGVTFAGLLAAYFVHAKIYVNCMFASLNSRERLRARVSEVIEFEARSQNTESPVYESRQTIHVAPVPTDGPKLPPPASVGAVRARSRTPFDNWHLIQ
ncbi:hypothetical protein OE88DRAFT_1736828 [Heliocybe sulcata]|uniref:DUF6534 domain-containing protein n=1 Tax=Heliocybe sulcata TaxID=5364 RepID=A0A5C3MXG0_9AGAM|nr:hypothetical protein OE88DRAFT_1736828 [Heliocybe sulcata]